MAVFLFLLAVIGGGVVGDLVLENTAGGKVSVLNQTVTGHTQGTLLALAAALGLVVGFLLVASMGSTKRRRARRKQLRSIRAGMQHHVAEPEGEQARLPYRLSRLQETGGVLGERARPAELGGERWVDQPDGRRVAPEPASHHPQLRHDQTGRAVHLREDPYPWFRPSSERAP
jgi:hypothetical protein